MGEQPSKHARLARPVTKQVSCSCWYIEASCRTPQARGNGQSLVPITAALTDGPKKPNLVNPCHVISMRPAEFGSFSKVGTLICSESLRFRSLDRAAHCPITASIGFRKPLTNFHAVPQSQHDEQ
jgi:hypothetical protein